MSEPVAEIDYEGAIRVRPYGHGTYLGDAFLQDLIERALGDRYGYGQGWEGFAEISMRLYEEPPGEALRRCRRSSGER